MREMNEMREIRGSGDVRERNETRDDIKKLD